MAFTSVSRFALAGICLSVALSGCQSFREATGSVKLPPDEMTVVTKSPLIIPPDYNLRPPQPGAPDRNTPDAAVAARQALFARDAAAATASLGAGYSSGEKMLLTKSGGAAADPNVRQNINADVGVEDKGTDFAKEVVNPSAAATPAARGSN